MSFFFIGGEHREKEKEKRKISSMKYSTLGTFSRSAHLIIAFTHNQKIWDLELPHVPAWWAPPDK
jgi:hypothetical protein